MSSKQAYLIMVHENSPVLMYLLRMLDAPFNDIYIHVDKKATSFRLIDYKNITLYSRLYFTDRIKVTWGAYSQIQAELCLLNNAVKQDHYQHYHLLSGADLPIKNKEYIYNFFMDHPGEEFIRIESPVFSYDERIRYYYFLQEFFGRGNVLTKTIEKVSIALQNLFRVSRNGNIKFQKGSNWFSITDEFARYILKTMPSMYDVFKYTKCADEIFLQTLCINSPYIDNLYHPQFDNDIHSIMRLIDWERGTPYVYHQSDINDILNSDMLFARKFDWQIDAQIIVQLYDHFRN